MRTPRFSLKWVITVTSLIAAAYVLGILFQFRFAAIAGLYFLTLTATVWMVIRILKDPYSTTKTFDEYFYQDREDIRRSGPE